MLLILFMDTLWKQSLATSRIHLQVLQRPERLKQKLHSIISQLPHITTAKHFAATATF